MTGKIRLAFEKRLRDRGIASPDIRRILSGQVLFALSCLTAGLILLPFSDWPLAFGLGATLAVLNFWQLTRSVFKTVRRSYAPGLLAMHLGAFFVRFAMTGVLIYIFLVRLHLPVLPLLAGLSTVTAALAIRGVTGVTGTFFKEAA